MFYTEYWSTEASKIHTRIMFLLAGPGIAMATGNFRRSHLLFSLQRLPRGSQGAFLPSLGPFTPLQMSISTNTAPLVLAVCLCRAVGLFAGSDITCSSSAWTRMCADAEAACDARTLGSPPLRSRKVAPAGFPPHLDPNLRLEWELEF